MKKSRYIAIAGALCLAMQAWASPMTPEESLSRALGSGPMKLRGADRNYQLAMTRKADTGKPGVYLFTKSESGNFLVTSADDNTPALLGYGDMALGRDGQAAPGFLYWLDELAREVAYAGEKAAKAPARAATEREPIAPMCSTKWNQDAPYNDMCPVVNGAVSVTGCSATAAAQVLKYHNWPETGAGTVSYLLKATGEELSMDLGATTFDWEAMLDSYVDPQGSPEQRAAVALLMKALGYSMEMMYSPQGSGAYSFTTARLLADNFRYDKCIRFLRRDWYTMADWNDVVYKSLAEFGPVIYNGQSNAGGHSFVCDGYDKDDYFHINWGWGGVSDGYFLLNALDPYSQGIGGSASGDGFNFMQDIICDIRPDRDGTSSFTPIIAVDGNLKMGISGNNLVIPSMIYNSGPGKLETGRFAIVLTPVTLFNYVNGEPIYSVFDIDGLEQNYGYRDMELSLEEFPAGHYKVNLEYSYDGETWLPVMMAVTGDRYFGLDVNGEKPKVAAIKSNCPDVLSLEIPESFDAVNTITITGKFANNTDALISSNLRGVVIPAEGELDEIDTLLGTTSSKRLQIVAGKERSLTISSKITIADGLEEGDYRILVAFVDGSGGYIPVSEPQPIRYTATSGVDGILDDATGNVSTYYSLDGLKVAETEAGAAAPALPAGIYIVRQGSETSKIVVE